MLNTHAMLVIRRLTSVVTLFRPAENSIHTYAFEISRIRVVRRMVTMAMMVKVGEC